MFKRTFLSAALLGLMAAGAQAAEIQPNGYLFANIGQSDADASNIRGWMDEDADYIATVLGFEGRSSFDEKDSAFKVGAGIQLNQHVAVEFQYIDLGEISYKAYGSNGAGTGVLKGTAGTDGMGVNLVGTLPFDQFKLFGKVGYHKLKTDAKRSLDLNFPGVFSGREELKDDTTEWVNSFGVGASYAFTPTVELVAEYEVYRDVADEYDVDFASIGLRYNF